MCCRTSFPSVAHENIPVFGRVRVHKNLVFFGVFCVLMCVCLSFSISDNVVISFSNCKLECRFGINCFSFTLQLCRDLNDAFWYTFYYNLNIILSTKTAFLQCMYLVMVEPKMYKYAYFSSNAEDKKRIISRAELDKDTYKAENEGYTNWRFFCII